MKTPVVVDGAHLAEDGALVNPGNRFLLQDSDIRQTERDEMICGTAFAA
jgi:hypothetical protein